MAHLSDTPVSILDLSWIPQGSTAAVAFQNTLDLARHADEWGFRRFWVAEHHNMPGIASAATSVVIGHVAGGTRRIRVGAGGIMLPNHAPLVIAEQFGTLESLYPGRIDLGIGRAPGTDGRTAFALRRTMARAGDAFREDFDELRAYLQPGGPGNGVHAVPGEGLDIPIWLLGSSDYGARLAAELGLPFAFASHFAPEHLSEALGLYRRYFQPSNVLDQPYAMIGVNVFLADTEGEARSLFTSLEQQFVNLIRGTPSQLPPPRQEGLRLTHQEAALLRERARYSVVGTPETARGELQKIIDQTGANEIMATAAIYDHQARIKSFGMLAELFGLRPA